MHVLCGDDRRRDLVEADLLRVVRTGERGHAGGIAELLGGHLVHEIVGAELDALREHEHGHVRAEEGRELMADPPKEARGRGEDDGLDTGGSLLHRGGRTHVGSHLVVDEVAGVVMSRVDRLDDVGLERPLDDLVDARRDETRHGGAP